MMKMTLMPNEEKRRNSRLPCPARTSSIPRCCWAERRVGGTGSPESERSNELNGGGRQRGGGSMCRGSGGAKWCRWLPCPSRLAPAPPASLSRLRVEKIEGGLMVAGVLVAANCRIALPAFGCLFLLAGAVLTAASYRGQAIGEDSDHYAARVAFTGNSRVLGPACLVVGFLMAAIGVGLCFLTRRAREREGERRARRVGFHCPIHGDFWAAAPAAIPHSPSGGGTRRGTLVPSDKPINKKRRLLLSLCPRGVADEDEEERGLGPNLVPPPLCPHSALSSTRSSLSSSWQPEATAAASPGATSRCPTPVPFVMSCSISSGMANSLGPGGGISPDHTAFGSIRSLSVSREVASFPLSRTPSPPPVQESLPGHIVQPNLMTPEDCPGQTNTNLLPLITIPCAHPVNGENELHHTVLPPLSTEHGCISAGPRKSVSILLPTDEDSGQKRSQSQKFEEDKVREEKG